MILLKSERLLYWKIKKTYKLKNKSYNNLVVLIGGVYGLHLLNLSKSVYWISLIIGVFYIYFIMKTTLNTNARINKILEEFKKCLKL